MWCVRVGRVCGGALNSKQLIMPPLEAGTRGGAKSTFTVYFTHSSKNATTGRFSHSPGITATVDCLTKPNY